MRIGVISDGKYGERAFANIKKKFETIWIIYQIFLRMQCIEKYFHSEKNRDFMINISANIDPTTKISQENKDL